MSEVINIVVLPAIPAWCQREWRWWKQPQTAAENLVGIVMEVLNIGGYGGNYNY